MRPYYSNASPIKFNGRLGGWLGPNQPARYVIEPLDDGAHRVTCTVRFRSTPDKDLQFVVPGEQPEDLSSDSYVEGRVVLRVAANGQAELDEAPSAQAHLLPKATTVLGRLDEAFRSINLPSL